MPQFPGPPGLHTASPASDSPAPRPPAASSTRWTIGSPARSGWRLRQSGW